MKAQNDQLLYIIDQISLGIQNRKKIAFRMFNFDTNKCQIPRHGGEVYVISPYNTVWKDDRYYVVGFSDKRKTVVSMRIDRMELPDLLDEDSAPPPADYNVQDYTDTITKMYVGAKKEVTLRCQTELIDNIVDKFGNTAKISNVTDTTFDATVTVAVSGTFLSWVFEYAGEMIILAPESVRKMYSDMLRTAASEMTDGRFSRIGKRDWKL